MLNNGWTWSDDMAGTCSLCAGVIPAREPHQAGNNLLDGAPRRLCLSCFFSAAGPMLPGSPRRVTVELVGPLDVPEGFPHKRYRVAVLRAAVTGRIGSCMPEELGNVTVGAGIADDQQVPALMKLISVVLGASLPDGLPWCSECRCYHHETAEHLAAVG